MTGHAQTLRASATYFALVFGAGFLLGLVRIPILVPRLGERTAELLEMPVMLAVIFFASRHVVRRFGLAASQRRAAVIGLLALAFLVGAELLLAVVLAGDSVADYIARKDPVSGTVYAASLLIFAVMPWLQARRMDTV
jgi:uncharacterized protein YqgC (DUF456 family)